MQATRRLLSPGSGFSLANIQPRFLLPPPTLLELGRSSLGGAWAVLTEQRSRDRYERAIRDGVVRDDVLGRSSQGAVLIYSLFHNLYGPEAALAEGGFDARAFLRAVGPALENFHDAHGRLQNELRAAAKADGGSSQEAERARLLERLQQSDEELLRRHRHRRGDGRDKGKGDNGDKDDDDDAPAPDEVPVDATEVFLGANEWRRQATEDPNGLAADLSRMTTPTCFDAAYYAMKLSEAFFSTNLLFVDCAVKEVALLRARAMVLLPEEPDTVGEYDEFRASERVGRPDDVAAQMDVLYELVTTHRARPDDRGDAPAPGSAVGAETTLKRTNLAVAVFEGWLSGGPDRELRWRIANVRDAVEFPDYVPTIEKLE